MSSLFIGHWSSPRLDQLRETIGPGRSVTGIADAIADIRAGQCDPELVVVWQSIPNEYPAADVEELIGLLPLAHWVVIFSPWCESQGRTEAIWPTGWCVSLCAASARLQWETRRLRRGAAPLPATASRDESFAASVERSCLRHPLSESESFFISADDAEWRDCVADVLRTQGLLPADDATTGLVLILRTLITDETARDIEALRLRFPKAFVMVTCDLARDVDHPPLKAAGASAVVSSLHLFEELAAAMNRTMASAS